MKRNLRIYTCAISLIMAFTFQSCYKEYAIEDLGWPEEIADPTITIAAPIAGQVVNITNIAPNVTVNGTTTGTSLKSLSYTLNGTEVALTSFDGNSPDFSFDLDFSHLAVGTNEDVYLMLTLKDAQGKEVSQTVTFKVKMNAYVNPTVVITSPTTNDEFLIAANVPNELASDIPNTAITITGTVQSQGASIYTYDIGNGPQPLTVVNGIFSQEILLSNVADMETKVLTLTINATDETSQTGSSSVTFSANRWDIGSTGAVSFNYSGTPVTYKTVRAKDGNVWLQQNLGAERVATAFDDVASYGDYFQWGRWADGHQKSNSATVPSNTINPNNPLLFANQSSIANPFVLQIEVTPGNYIRWWPGTATDTWSAARPDEITATNGCDPCKQTMGNGWRLPTKAEWDNIITKEGITLLPSAFSSTLKIPAAGYKHRTTAVASHSAGILIFIWTSNTTSSMNSILVEIRTGFNATTAPWVRAYGASVRCIKKN